MTITKKTPTEQWRGRDVHQGDSLHVLAVTESEFLVEISRAEGRAETVAGKAG